MFDYKLCITNRFLFQTIMNLHFVVLFKGQLISKCLFGIFNSPKKRAKKFDFTTMVPQVELFSFIFWESWRHQKDISKTWPKIQCLEGGKMTGLICQVGLHVLEKFQKWISMQSHLLSNFEKIWTSIPI